ncbi:hypothetical protein BKA81DRAFT_225384 [Phyllosticta paracitricarpa]|uniref:Fungal lipase-like domain-containing protein n=2 Tax=Phyllosticta TaxID=121621 RepID=A0ABR1MFY9_9PEZI
MTGVAYIPIQTPDQTAFTSDVAALSSPIRILLRDTLLLFRNLKHAPLAFEPRVPLKELPHLQCHDHVTPRRDFVLVALATALEALLGVVSGPLVLFLSGWMVLLFICLAYSVLLILLRAVRGPLIVTSRVDMTRYKALDKEKWYFVNGVGTSHRALQHTVDRLAVTFQRPITGIHNRTYGVLGDLVVCLFQRCFRYNTADVRCVYEMLKLQILEPGADKVVLLAHGQGACVASLALDRMLLEVPSKSLGKLEIFTFGCAASHFNNPLSHSYLTILLQNSALNPVLSSRPRHVVPIIEHYANENDPFARWGVLNSTRDCPGQRFAGQVFINKDASGHLFNQHYLDAMFALPPARMADLSMSNSRGSDSAASDHSSDNSSTEASLPSPPPRPTMSPFLDRMVDVDYGTAARRAETVDAARIQGFGVMPAADEAQAGAKAARGAARGRRTSVVDETQLALGEGAGRTVRQLSRLWLYVGGGESKRREDEHRSRDVA